VLRQLRQHGSPLVRGAHHQAPAPLDEDVGEVEEAPLGARETRLDALPGLEPLHGVGGLPVQEPARPLPPDAEPRERAGDVVQDRPGPQGLLRLLVVAEGRGHAVVVEGRAGLPLPVLDAGADVGDVEAGHQGVDVHRLGRGHCGRAGGGLACSGSRLRRAPGAAAGRGVEGLSEDGPPLTDTGAPGGGDPGRCGGPDSAGVPVDRGRPRDGGAHRREAAHARHGWRHGSDWGSGNVYIGVFSRDRGHCDASGGENAVNRRKLVARGALGRPGVPTYRARGRASRRGWSGPCGQVGRGTPTAVSRRCWNVWGLSAVERRERPV